MWDIIRDLVAGGITVFLTTQYLEEADRLATRIGLLDRGRIVAEGTPAELKRLVPGGSIRLEFADPRTLDAAVRTLGGGSRDESAVALQLPSDGGIAVVRQVLSRLEAASIEVDGISVRPADLDDVFLSLTGRQDRQEVQRS
jgi:ABC-2 type transport system ATP-binding protein